MRLLKIKVWLKNQKDRCTDILWLRFLLQPALKHEKAVISPPHLIIPKYGGNPENLSVNGSLRLLVV
jgi:hypothetical protein